jgi:hypothetical protein
MGLITETNQQYYQGAQQFIADGASGSFVTTFDTNLILGSFDPTDVDYALNNFKLFTSATGLPGSFIEYNTSYLVLNNTIVLGTVAVPVIPTVGTYFVIQLKSLDGGNYGNGDAFGTTVEDNYGSYEYIKLSDAIDNFMVGYVGDGKILQNTKKSDVLFFAKRSLQEFSYDTLKSVHSQELTIPPSLSVVLPQGYVNYVRVSFIDQLGVKRIIYPANNLTINPYENPIQDAQGVPTQDNFGENLEGTSITEERWAGANDNLLNGLDPQLAQSNGWFTLNEREGKMSFSSNLANRLIVLEYISDGLAHDVDTKVPKLAEDALYASILHSIVSTRSGQQEYLVQRLQKDRRAKLRNAKIRLSNIKLDEIVQVMRGKSKWIKH